MQFALPNQLIISQNVPCRLINGRTKVTGAGSNKNLVRDVPLTRANSQTDLNQVDVYPLLTYLYIGRGCKPAGMSNNFSRNYITDLGQNSYRLNSSLAKGLYNERLH